MAHWDGAQGQANMAKITQKQPISPPLKIPLPLKSPLKDIPPERHSPLKSSNPKRKNFFFRF